MKVVRVAIIGAGMISERHMEIYKNIQRNAELLGFTAKVVAVSEINEKILKTWAERYGFAEKDCYTDFREMLKRDDIDTVDVCVHNNLHTPISIEVMKRGYDCYTEKPAAASYHDAKMMIDCAKKLGRKFHVQISSLMTPQTRIARDLVQKGALGDVYYVNLEMNSMRRRPGYDIPEFTADFYSRRIAGHGASIDLGVYLVSQLLFVLGMPEIKSVNGFVKQGMELDQRLITNPDGFGVEDISDGFAKFENGLGFHFFTTSASNFRDYKLTYILGSKGGLEITEADTYGGKFAREPGDPNPLGQEPELRFYGEVAGNDVTMNLNCDRNGIVEVRKDPKMLLYNDNQAMWLAYKLGILDDTTRYNTPEIALRMLQFTDGIFLSQELGREVMAEEIIAMSPTLYIPEQEIAGNIVKYDVTF